MDGAESSICVHKEKFCLRMDSVSESIAWTNCFNLEVLCDEGGRMLMVDNEKRLCWGNCSMGPSLSVSTVLLSGDSMEMSGREKK